MENINVFEVIDKMGYPKDRLQFLKDRLIFAMVGGSHAYGTALPTSDLDIRGIFMEREEDIVLDERVEQFEDKNQDVVFYSLHKALTLIAKNNPNMHELLWCDESDILFNRPEYNVLRNARVQLLSRQAADTYTGYAIAQLKRIKTHDKWLTKEQEGKFNKRPHITDYILFIDRVKGYVSKLIEESNTHYYIKVKDEVYNVFRNLDAEIEFPLISSGNNFVPTRLEKYKEDDTYCGIIIFNKSQFHQDLDEYTRWETWKNNRNVARHELEKEHGYDTKHAMHLVRLLRMGVEIFEKKEVIIKRPDAKELLEIRNGKYTYENILDIIAGYETRINELEDQSDLPTSIKKQTVQSILRQIYEL